MEDNARKVEEGFGHAPLAKKEHDKAHFSGNLNRIDSGHWIENENDERSPVLDQPIEQKVEEQPLVRVATLDAFRGLTIVVSVHTHTHILLD